MLSLAYHPFSKSDRSNEGTKNQTKELYLTLGLDEKTLTDDKR
jgi:hypothetical protein